MKFGTFFTGRKVLGLLVGSLSLVALAGWAGKERGFCHKSMSPEQAETMSTRMLDHALDDLDVSDAQRKELQGLRGSLVKEGMALKNEKKESMEEALTLWNSPNPDAAQVHALLDSRIDEMRTFAHSAADKALEAHRILTPEQRAEVAKKISDRHKD